MLDHDTTDPYTLADDVCQFVTSLFVFGQQVLPLQAPDDRRQLVSACVGDRVARMRRHCRNIPIGSAATDGADDPDLGQVAALATFLDGLPDQMQKLCSLFCLKKSSLAHFPWWPS